MKFNICLIAIIILLISNISLNTNSFEGKLYPTSIKTPIDLEEWLINNFDYKPDILKSDHWKSPIQTVADKGGDCEDFAILACKVLKDLGFKCHVIAIFFNDGGHAIAVFKDVDGKLSYFTNQYYIRSKSNNIKELLNNEYPDWLTAYKTFNESWLFYRFYKNS